MSSQAGAVLRRPGVSTSAYLLGGASAIVADGAWSQRKINRDYTGYAFNCRRSSDNATMDIGFSTSEDLDTTSLLAWAGTDDVFITTRYDQSQQPDGTLNNRHIIYLSPANQPRIVHNGVLETKNGLPVLRAPDENRGGITNPFTAYTGTAVTTFAVGAMSTTSSDGPPIFLGLLPSANAGMNTATGAALLTRLDSSLIGKTDTLVDDFATQDSLKWAGWGGNVSYGSQQVAITPTSIYSGLVSASKYDLTSSSFTAKLVQRASRGNNTIENVLQASMDSSNYMSFVISSVSLIARERAAGVNSDLGVTYNATNHAYLRLREASGTLYWEASPDGSAWTVIRSKTRAMSNPTSVLLKLQAGYYGTETSVGTCIWDNVNTTVSHTATAAWAIERGSTSAIANATATANTLQQVVAQINGALATLTIDGVQSTGSLTSAAFSFNRYGLGHNGTYPQSAPDSYDAEILVFNKAVGSTDQGTICANQQAYWNTASQTPDPSSGYTLIAEDTFEDNVFRSIDFTTYNFGVMTSSAGAWMSDCVSVSNGRLRLLCQRLTTPTTIGGTNYYRKGGGLYWRGPNGSAFAKGGMWQARVRMDACSGFGWAILLWPKEGQATDPTKPNYFPGFASWPINGEIDILELYSGNTNKTGGESNWHLDTVAGSGRHLKSPQASTHSPTALVSAGNYQTDWTTFHDLKIVWIPGQRIECYIDNVLVGNTTDTSYVPSGIHNSYDVPFRFTFQIECYGTADSVADFNPHYAEIDMVRYYAAS